MTDPLLSDAQLRGFAATAGQELTYTCVPPGEGVRVGIDRDLDGCPDRSELDAGTDPANPLSVPAVCGGSATTTTTPTDYRGDHQHRLGTTTTTMIPLALIETRSLTLKDNVNPAKRKFTFKSSTKQTRVRTGIDPPQQGTTGDPTLNGGELIIYNAAGLTSDSVSVPLLGRMVRDRHAVELQGWRFKSTDSSSAVSSVVVETDKITVKGGKSAFGYTLNEPQQGSVGVRLLLGPGGWCAEAPAKTSGNPPSTTRNDTVDKFVGEPKSPAPAMCPALPH